MLKKSWLLATCVLAACIQAPVQIGAAGLPAEDMAVLNLSASESMDNAKVPEWGYTVLEVDGMVMKSGVDKIALLAGQHSIKYVCWGQFGDKNTARLEGSGYVINTFLPGDEYFGKISKLDIGQPITTEHSIRTSGSGCEWTGLMLRRPGY